MESTSENTGFEDHITPDGLPRPTHFSETSCALHDVVGSAGITVYADDAPVGGDDEQRYPEWLETEQRGAF